MTPTCVRGIHAIGALTAFLFLPLVGCDAAGGQQRPIAAQVAFNQRATRAQHQQPLLLVANNPQSNPSYIIGYTTNEKNKIVRDITEGVNESTLATGSDGSLYSANANAGSVTVYNLTTGALVRKLKKGMRPVLTQIALDSAGTLYVKSSKFVEVYPNGRAKGMYRVLPIYHNLAEGMAIDPAGTLAIGTQADVELFEPGTTQPSEVISSGIVRAATLAFDSSNNLYVVNSFNNGSCGNVLVFNPGQTSPAYKIPSSNTVCFWNDIVQGPDGNMYAITRDEIGNGSVSVYPYGQSTPSRVITDGLERPTSLAFDSGNLYVSDLNGNHVSVYAPGSSAVLRTITANLSSPTSIVVSK
jgi:sugar lactone lactonase YvrE